MRLVCLAVGTRCIAERRVEVSQRIAVGISRLSKGTILSVVSLSFALCVWYNVDPQGVSLILSKRNHPFRKILKFIVYQTTTLPVHAHLQQLHLSTFHLHFSTHPQHAPHPLVEV